jgi:hypothetical protein
MSARVWKQGLLTVPGVGVSLLPKLICPLCWPAYAALLSALGLGFLISTAYLFPLTALFLALADGSLAFRASRRRGLGPFWLGLAASIVVLIGKFHFDSVVAMFLGVGILVAASVWNAWPRRPNVDVCDRCILADNIATIKERVKKEL